MIRKNTVVFNVNNISEVEKACRYLSNIERDVQNIIRLVDDSVRKTMYVRCDHYGLLKCGSITEDYSSIYKAFEAYCDYPGSYKRVEYKDILNSSFILRHNSILEGEQNG